MNSCSCALATVTFHLTCSRLTCSSMYLRLAHADLMHCRFTRAMACAKAVFLGRHRGFLNRMPGIRLAALAMCTCLCLSSPPQESRDSLLQLYGPGGMLDQITSLRSSLCIFRTVERSCMLPQASGAPRQPPECSACRLRFKTSLTSYD